MNQDRSLYHQSKAQDSLNRLRERYRQVVIDNEGATRMVKATRMGLVDDAGSPISGRIDYKGRLMDSLEPRFYYDF